MSFVLALLAACSGNGGGDDTVTDDLPEAQSGTRLRLVWLDFDGTRQLQGVANEHEYSYGQQNPDFDVFFDAARQEMCAPLTWPDGITRCTPANSSGIAPNQLAVIKTMIATAIEGGGGRVHKRYHTSDDGMSVLVGLDDTLAGESRLVRDRATELVLPIHPEFAAPNQIMYADASCKEAYGRMETGSPAPKVFVSQEPLFYPAGAKASTPPRYERQVVMGCVMVAPPQGDFYRIDFAHPIAPVALAPAVDDDPAHRIQHVHASNGDLSMPLRRLYDAQFQTACEPWLFPDGVYRCAPRGALVEYLVYSDFTCSTPLELAQVYVDPPPTLVFEDETSGRPVEVRELLGKYTDPVYAGGSSNCVPLDQQDQYQVGRVVEWSELAIAMLATD